MFPRTGCYCNTLSPQNFVVFYKANSDESDEELVQQPNINNFDQLPVWAQNEITALRQDKEQLKNKVTEVTQTNLELNENMQHENIHDFDKESFDAYNSYQDRTPLIPYTDEVIGNDGKLLTHQLTGMIDPSRRQARKDYAHILQDRAGTDSLRQPYADRSL